MQSSNIKIGLDISTINTGTYVLIDKQKFLKFMNSIKDKNPKMYDKLSIYLTYSNVIIEENNK